MKEFSFGVRCKLEIFFFGVRIGVEDAKSLDLLHDFSLSVQTCLSFFFFAFKLMHSAHGEMQWQKLAERKREKKSPEIAKFTTQSIVFFKGRINEIFVNYYHSLFQTFQPRPSLKKCLFAVALSCIFWMGM